MDVTVGYHTIACRDRQPYNFCNNSFSAYVWESNTTIAIPDPITSYSSYRRFATYKHPQNADHSLTIPLHVNSKFIALGFHDQGGCRRLYSVKVSYDVCVGKTLKDSLVSLPETLPPLGNLRSVPVEGKCTTDSVQAVQGSITVLCESSGEWNTSLLEGIQCLCKENRENTGGICSGMFLFVCFVSKECSLPHSRWVVEYCFGVCFVHAFFSRAGGYAIELYSGTWFSNTNARGTYRSAS